LGWLWFSIWCQLLTHISRASKSDLIIIDEPEVYLHPDVQRQLLGILRDISPDIILATHSTEILGEADSSEILLVDKLTQSAKRLKDIAGIQEALDSIGSIQNITLAQLAKTRKILFVEGIGDYKILRRFAKLLGLDELATGSNLTQLESGGFTSWERVKALSWGIKKTLNTDISIGTIYDRDFWCESQIKSIQASLEEDISFAHIHNRKEMENYLLVPEVLSRVLEKSILDKEKRTGLESTKSESITDLLEKITSKNKTYTLSQYMSKYRDFNKKTGKDNATLDSEVLTWFDSKWNSLSSRMEIVSGKDVLRELRALVGEMWGITLTDYKIIDEFKTEEIPMDIKTLLSRLELYRLS
jgi:predicted ATP-dependent endonuclease of OLD family